MIRSPYMTGLLLACALAAPAAKPAAEEWTFDDTGNPLQASVETRRSACMPQGKPVALCDGVTGNALRFDGETSRLFYEIPSDASLIDGQKSFTVECYVKTGNIGYYLFAGSRCVPSWYKNRGWALGLLNTGNIMFTIADGENRSYSWVNHLQGSWDAEEWNHVAAVRDAGANTIRLYVNGERTDNVKHYRENKIVPVCAVGSIANDAAIRIGRCSMTGGYFDGALDGLRITAGIVPEEEIRRRAQIARQAKPASAAPAANPETAGGIEVFAPARTPPVPLTLQPAPKAFGHSAERVTLPLRFTILPGNRPMLRDAAQELAAELTRAFGVTNPATASTVPEAGTTIELRDNPRLRPEGYALRGASESGTRYAITVEANAHAIFYAVQTLQQLLRITSLENGCALSLPRTFTIDDWPSTPLRMTVTGLPRRLGETDYDRFMAQMAARRFNAIHYSPSEATVGELTRLCRSGKRYGVDVIAWFSYLHYKEPLSPLREEDRLALKAFMHKIGEAGVAGVTFAFDDLSGKHLEIVTRPEERKAYGGRLGRLHNAVMIQALAYAKPGTLKHRLAMPFLYSRGWEKAVAAEGSGKDYFRDFCAGFAENGITLLHTAATLREVEDLRRAGAPEVGYYINGFWPTHLFFTWFMGDERLAWSWNLFRIDRNGRGPEPLPDAIPEVKRRGERARVIFGASSSKGTHLCGIFAWDPAAYDEERAGRYLAQWRYGAGIYEPLRRYAENVGPVIAYFRAHKTSWANEAKAPETPREAPVTVAELQSYWRNYRDAAKAWEEIKTAASNQTHVLRQRVAPDTGAPPEWTLMESSLDAMGRKLTRTLSRKAPGSASGTTEAN